MRPPFEPVYPNPPAPTFIPPSQPSSQSAPPGQLGNPYDPSLHVVCQTSRLPPSVVQDFLDFCRKVQPQRTSRFGVAFYEDISVTNALALLQACNFDVQMAKFKVIFPVLTRYCDVTRITFDPSVDYGMVVNDFIIKTTMTSGVKEKSYFDSLHKLVVVERQQTPYKTIRPFVEDGLRNKCPLSADLRKELERCKKVGKEIQKILEEPKVLSRIDRELTSYRTLLILPENFEELLTAREGVVEMQRRVREFLAPENFQKKDFGEMTRLVEEINSRNIAEECSNEFKIFFDFFRKTTEMYQKIDWIVMQTPPPPEAPRLSMVEAYQLLDDLTNSPLEHKARMQALIVVIFRKEIHSEKCMMFCEDERTTDVQQFTHFSNDLKKGALDFSDLVRQTDLKIKTLEHLDFIHQNIRVPSRLEENLANIETLLTLNSTYYVKETAKLAKYLGALVRIRDLAFRIASVSGGMARYLFQDLELVDVSEFPQLLKDVHFVPSKTHIFSFVDEVGRRLLTFEQLLTDLADYKQISTAALFLKFQRVFELGLQNQLFEDEIRAELAGRIEIEYFVSLLFEKFATTPCPFLHPEFTETLEARTRLLPTFDECKDRVLAEIDKLKNQDVLRSFKQLVSDRQALNEAIDRFFFEEDDLQRQLMAYEDLVRMKFKDRELVVKAQTKAKFVSNQKRVLAIEDALHRTFPEVEEKLAGLNQAEKDVASAKEFVERETFAFLEIYDRARKTRVEFEEKLLRGIIELLNKKRSNEDKLLEEISGKIRSIKDKLAQMEAEFEGLFGCLEKEETSFVLKTLRLVLLATSLHLAGLSPAFRTTIDTYISNYRQTEHQLSLNRRKTVIEARTLVVKFEELHIYSPNAVKLQHMLTLAETFVARVEALDMDVRGEELNAIDASAALQTNVRLGEYDIDWVDECLELNRRTFNLLLNEEFIDFLNKKGKRIKKYSLINDPTRRSEGEQSQVIESLRTVVPALVDSQARPFCLCREGYEVGEMVQFTKCNEWFHCHCLKVAEGESERLRDHTCVGCDFLEGRKCQRVEIFVKRKIKKTTFEELVHTAGVLGEFLLDPAIDFMRIMERKLAELKVLVRELKQARDSAKPPAEIGALIHTTTLLYLYVPVQLEGLEKTLLYFWGEVKAAKDE